MQIALGNFWSPFGVIIRTALRFFWPLVLIGIGGFVVYLATTGAFSRRQPPEFTFTTPQPGTRLYRCRSDRVIAGVCGGLANYLGMDPTIVRIIAVALLLLGVGSLGVAYIVAWLVIPEE